MLGIPDPASIVSAVVTGINQFIALRRLNEWAKLIFTIAFSYCASFSFVCGGFLAGGKDFLFSAGSGMVAGTLAITYLFRRSSLTSGLAVVLPAEEAKEEMGANLQVIQRK